jgi:hypothetical protein
MRSRCEVKRISIPFSKTRRKRVLEPTLEPGVYLTPGNDRYSAS